MRGGKREGAGRPKGSTGKAATQLKDAILQAFDKAGGVKYLQTLAVTHPPVFATLLGRVLSMTVAGDPEQPHKLIIEWQEPDASG